jgi:hypothetical protein
MYTYNFPLHENSVFRNDSHYKLQDFEPDLGMFHQNINSVIVLFTDAHHRQQTTETFRIPSWSSFFFLTSLTFETATSLPIDI